MKKKTRQLSRREWERLEDELDVKLARETVSAKGPSVPWAQKNDLAL
jgi:hypothetical protein